MRDIRLHVVNITPSCRRFNIVEYDESGLDIAVHETVVSTLDPDVMKEKMFGEIRRLKEEDTTHD